MGKTFFLTITLFLILFNQAGSQDDPNNILKAFKEKVEEVESYTADVLIRVEVDFIKIKDRKARITYTKPNQFEFKAEGFTLLPKKGMEMEYISMINEGYMAILIKEEVVNGHTTKLIKVIPDNSEGDIILAEMWIDPDTYLMHKMKTYSKTSGTYTINFFFADHPYDLPDKIIVEFEVKNNKLPVSFTGDIESLGDTKKGETSEGKVIIQYSNYKVN